MRSGTYWIVEAKDMDGRIIYTQEFISEDEAREAYLSLTESSEYDFVGMHKTNKKLLVE